MVCCQIWAFETFFEVSYFCVNNCDSKEILFVFFLMERENVFLRNRFFLFHLMEFVSWREIIRHKWVNCCTTVRIDIKWIWIYKNPFLQDSYELNVPEIKGSYWHWWFHEEPFHSTKGSLDYLNVLYTSFKKKKKKKKCWRLTGEPKRLLLWHRCINTLWKLEF